VFIDVLAALGAMPGIQKRRGVFFQPAADNYFGFSHGHYPIGGTYALGGHLRGNPGLAVPPS
jgi:hypothetical protein